MSEHRLDWIGAYHDGELPGEQRRWLEAHLRACAVCQAELAALQGLSARLQASPPLPARTPPEQFVAQVRLRLPPRSAPVPGRARLRQAAGLWLPLGVLALWALGQAVLAVGGVVLLAGWGAGAPPAVAALANPALGVVQLLVLDMVLTAVAAGLVWGCLAGWWAARETNLASSGAQSG